MVRDIGLEGNLVSDLSQQIVKNMDQELQYLKQLTSSNTRPASNLSLENSPESILLGKRKFDTDPGQKNLSSYESTTKLYKPDPMSGFNYPNMKLERKGIFGEENE